MDANKEMGKEVQAIPIQEKKEVDAQSLIQQANSAAERLEMANKRHQELLTQEAELYAKQRLGGRTEAGQAPIIPVEQTAKEYAMDLWNGKIRL